MFRAFISPPPIFFENHRPYRNEPYALSFNGEIVERGRTNEFGCLSYWFKNVPHEKFITISSLERSWDVPVDLYSKFDRHEMLDVYLRLRGYHKYIPDGYNFSIDERNEPSTETIMKSFQYYKRLKVSGIVDKEPIAMVRKGYLEIYSDKHCR